jgi:hypothetical protein
LKEDEVDFEVGDSSLHAWMRQYHGLGNVLEQIVQIVQIELMIGDALDYHVFWLYFFLVLS